MKGRLRSWRVWWRDRVPLEDKIVAGLFGLVAISVAGWIAANSLSTASAGAASTLPLVETVERVVTVHAPGKSVTTRVPVVRHVVVARTKTDPATTVVRTETAYGTSTVTVPTVVTHLVTAPAHTVTQAVTQSVTTTVTKVQWRVITVVQKSKPVTVTVTTPAPAP
jgi:hypothetical protein